MAKDLESCRIIFVMGGPGTGKATSCKKLEEHGFKIISMVEVLKQEVNSGSELGNKIKDYMDSHNMVPLNFTISTLRDRLLKEVNEFTEFAIIGFPRDIDQATKFEKELAKIDVVIYLKASDEVMMTRTQQRAKDEGLEVDAEKVLRKIEWFKTHQSRVLDYFTKKRKVCEIDCALGFDVVWQKVFKCITKKL